VERADLRRKNWRGVMNERLKAFFDHPAILQQIAAHFAKNAKFKKYAALQFICT
jgi:hypothetical protein